MAESLLKPSDVQEMLGISHTTLWRWTRDGLLPAVIIGTRYRRYRLEDVEALLTPSVVKP